MGRPLPTSTFNAAWVGVDGVALPPEPGCGGCAIASGGLATSAAAPAAAPLRNPRRPKEPLVFLELAIICTYKTTSTLDETGRTRFQERIPKNPKDFGV
jgi:hypothetical protein